MAFLNEAFDINELPVSESNYEPLPAGWYTACIEKAEIANTKAGTGQYIKIQYKVSGPTHAGRVVFGNLNIKNPNSTAEEIGRQQLGELMRSIGLARVSDTDQLIGGNLQIKLAIKQSEQYGDSNEIKGFKAINGSAAPMPNNSVLSAHVAVGEKNATVQQSAAATPPWAKK